MVWPASTPSCMGANIGRWTTGRAGCQAISQYASGNRRDRWGAYLWGRNITDTRAYSQYVSPSLGIGVAGLGFLVEPATYGIELNVKF